jgi:hypothetical protein
MTTKEKVMCEICTYAQQAALVYDDTVTDAFTDAIATAYIFAFAYGFNIRTEAIYNSYCERHAIMVRRALLVAGSKPVSVFTGPKGTA